METTIDNEPEVKPRKKGRVPRIGDSVHFWGPHASKDIGPAEKPQHAVIASVHEDGTATLAVLSFIGMWTQRHAVSFSEEPKTRSWTWPR